MLFSLINHTSLATTVKVITTHLRWKQSIWTAPKNALNTTIMLQVYQNHCFGILPPATPYFSRWLIWTVHGHLLSWLSWSDLSSTMYSQLSFFIFHLLSTSVMMMGIISASLHKLGTRSDTNISVVGTRKEIIVDKMHMARHAVQDPRRTRGSREDVAMYPPLLCYDMNTETHS